MRKGFSKNTRCTTAEYASTSNTNQGGMNMLKFFFKHLFDDAKYFGWHNVLMRDYSEHIFPF